MTQAEIEPPGVGAAAVPADASVKHKAADARIHETISAIYDQAKVHKMIPPNLHDIANYVLPRLERQGLTATKTRIQTLAGDQRHAGRRRSVGPRVYGTLLPFSDPEV